MTQVKALIHFKKQKKKVKAHIANLETQEYVLGAIH